MYLTIVVRRCLALTGRDSVYTFERKHEIEAVKLPSNAANTPRRLLIVPNLQSIAHVEAGTDNSAHVEWDPFLIREVMEWSDLLDARGAWSRVVIATSEFRASEIINGSFHEAWAAWVNYMCSVQLMHWTNAGPGFISAKSGCNVSQADVVARAAFFPREFFARYSTEYEAWTEILYREAPECVTYRLPIPNYSIIDMFAEGRIFRINGSSEAPDEVVIMSHEHKDGQRILRPRAFTIRDTLDF